MDSDFRFEYCPDEIAEVLCKLADFEPKGAIFNDVNKALYHWKLFVKILITLIFTGFFGKYWNQL